MLESSLQFRIILGIPLLNSKHTVVWLVRIWKLMHKKLQKLANIHSFVHMATFYVFELCICASKAYLEEILFGSKIVRAKYFACAHKLRFSAPLKMHQRLCL